MRIRTRLLPCLLGSAALIAVSLPSAAADIDPPLQRAKPSDGSTTVVGTDAEALGHAAFPIVVVQLPSDADYLPRILAAYRSGDAAEAEILKSKLEQPAAVAAAEWFAIRSGIAVGADRLAAFRRNYGDWPVTAQMQRRAEEALLASRRSSARVRAFFAERPPVSGAGRVALASALKSEGADK